MVRNVRSRHLFLNVCWWYRIQRRPLGASAPAAVWGRPRPLAGASVITGVHALLPVDRTTGGRELALPTPFQRWHLERCSAQESPPRAGNQATECDCQRVGHPGDWRQGILENISTKGSASFLLTKGSLARLAEEIIKERGSRFETLTIVMKRPVPWGSSFSPLHRERMERSSLEPFNPSPANDDLNRRIRRMNPRNHADHKGWRVATPHVLVR
jgi:hypothetical protein